MLSIIKELLLKIINDIDTGNSNLLVNIKLVNI